MHRLAVSIAVCSALMAMLPRTGETVEAATVRDQIGLLGEPQLLVGMAIFIFGVGGVYVLSVPCISMFMRVARQRHPKAMMLASSVEPTAFNIGISFGTAVGSAVVAGPGMASAGVVGAVFSLVACALTLLTMRIDRRRG